MKTFIQLTFLTILFLCNSCCVLKRSCNRFDSRGGEYTYPSGITLSIPPDALDSEYDISIEILSDEEKNTLADIRNIPRDEILFAINATPDNLRFNQPVKLSIPVSDLKPGMVPIVFQYDLQNHEADIAHVSFRLNHETKKIDLNVTHFSGFEGEIKEAIQNQECTNPSNWSCRCLDLNITQSDQSYACSVDDCQVTYSENMVQFVDCPDQPIESSIFEETTPGCEPELILTAEKDFIDLGETCRIMAQLKLGCSPPISIYNVGFEITGPGTIDPTNDFTDAEGNTYTTLTAGNEEGAVTITALCHFTYNTKRINVNGVDLVKETRTVNLDKTIEVYVIKKPKLTVSAADEAISTEETTTITALLTRGEEPIEGQEINFLHIGVGSINPISGNTTSNGNVNITFTAGTTEGTADVMVFSDVKQLLPNGTEIVIPVFGEVEILVGEEKEYAGTRWRFEHTAEWTNRIEMNWCRDHAGSRYLSCTESTNQVNESSNQQASGEFIITKEGPYHTITISNFSASMNYHKDSYTLCTTSRLDASLGGCGYGYIRKDCHDCFDEIDESLTYTTQDINDDFIKEFIPSMMYFKFWFRPNSDIEGNYIVQRSWNSRESNCPSLDWNGEKEYGYQTIYGFYGFYWDNPLSSGQWSWEDTWYNEVTRETFKLECLNCDY